MSMKFIYWPAAFLPLCLALSLHAQENLTLVQLQRIALERNHDVRVSALALDSAAAAVTSAAAAPNPMLTVQTMNINPGLGVGAGSLRSKTVDSSVRIDQLLERGGKRDLRRDSALHQAEGAREKANPLSEEE